MNTHFLKLSFIFFLFMGLFVTSCTEDSDSTNDDLLDEYAELVVTRTQDSLGVGRKGCFELVFPVTIVFGDLTTASVASYEEMKSAIKTWRENNTNSRIKPKIQLPFEVIKPDGEYVSISTDLEVRALRAICGKPGHGPKGPKDTKGERKLCFKPVFPFTLILPDKSEYVVNNADDRKGLREILKAYFKANPGTRERPLLKFPANFELSDGSTVTVNFKEELIALKDSCD